MLYSVKDKIAIRQPIFEKIEMELQGGLAVNSNRIRLQEAEVVMAYENNGLKLKPKDRVILKGDAGLKPWAKQKLIFGDKEFVLCPEGDIVGYVSE